jgi:hypothetical protein
MTLARRKRRGAAAFDVHIRSGRCRGGRDMQDHPLSADDPNLKAADEFLALAKTAPTPFMRAYYERVALRYLSSQGGLKTALGRVAPTAG